MTSANPGSVRWLWLLSAVFVVYGTTIPFHFVSGREHALANLSRAIAHPLTVPATGRRLSMPDVAQNVLLFVPFGLFGVAVLRHLTRRPATAVCAMALALSAGGEAAQLFTPDRTSSLSDLAANTLGAFAGGVLSGPCLSLFRRSVADLKRRRVLDGAWTYAALVATLLVLVAGSQPFDVTLDVSTIWSKVKLLRDHPWGMAAPGAAVLDLTRFAIWTTCLSIWLTELGVRRGILLAAAVAAATAVGLEAGQIFIESRTPALVDIAVAIVGIAFGAAAATTIRHAASPLWLWLLAAATWAGAGMQILNQFTPVPPAHAAGGHALVVPQAGESTRALSLLFDLALAYFPVGFAWAWRWRRSASAAATFAVAMQLAIELVLRALAGRPLRITDIAIAAAGAVVGAWAARSGWVRFRDYVTAP